MEGGSKQEGNTEDAGKMPDSGQEDIPQARFQLQSSAVSVGGTGCGDTPGQCDGDVLQGMQGLATWA